MIGALLLGGCGDDGGAGSTSQASETTVVDGSTGEPTGGPATEPTTGPTTVTSGDDGTGSTGEPTSGPTTDPTTGGEPACTVDGDCPQGAGVCQTGVCQANQCALVDLPADTAIADAPGDCRRAVCDGMGNLQEMPDDADLPIDAPGNCKAAVCTAGEPGFVADDLDLPGDDVECTADTCVQGTPTFTPKPVNSFCGAMGEQFCHDDLTCQNCKQVSEMCEDESNSEANETQLTAHGLGEITDADASGDFVCAVLDGADDVDWYTFKGNDAIFNFVDPTREVISDQNHRVCVYITCDNGQPQVGCGGDETKDTAPMGQPGCCGVGNVSPSLNCDGTDDSATIWIKVENVDALACVPYELKYHF